METGDKVRLIENIGEGYACRPYAGLHGIVTRVVFTYDTYVGLKFEDGNNLDVPLRFISKENNNGRA